jgi:molecular chaperone GrpE
VENKELMEDEVSAGTADSSEADALRDADAVREQRDNLKAERDELKDLLLRRQAEFDNFRKRAERERSDFAQYAGMEIVKELLPILDDFDRAMKVETADSEYARGVGMIHKRLFESLKKQGLEPIDTAGARFDHEVHHAVANQETDDAEDGAIIEEYQRGYNFKGKLLRAAMVKVARKP